MREITYRLKSSKYFILVFTLLVACSVCHAQMPNHGKKYPLRYAKNFEIVDFRTHRIVTVRAGSGDSALLYRYALVPRGASQPDLSEDITIIQVPAEKIVVLETIYVGFLEALNQLETIIGVATADYLVNPIIRKRIQEGIIYEMQTVQTLNVERLLLLEPDLIFISTPSEPTSNTIAQLKRAGLPAIITTEYQEHHPLARAEWIKFIAAFFDATEEANEIFDAIAARYEALLAKVDTIKNRPDVFCGAPYSGVWHMAGGGSYVAQLIRDAGGNYLWNNVNSANAIPLDIERVFLKAADADIWLNPSFYRTRSALFSADPRFRKFHAAQTGEVYNHPKQQTADNGNPIWESGMLHPDDVLADLIKIFHPDRMQDREFVYYEHLK
jgi:iron complex transport system substrate-binding protein